MLVIARKLRERLFIGEDVVITIVRNNGGYVRLGIDAPRHIKVTRDYPPSFFEARDQTCPEDDEDSSGPFELPVQGG